VLRPSSRVLNSDGVCISRFLSIVFTNPEVFASFEFGNCVSEGTLL